MQEYRCKFCHRLLFKYNCEAVFVIEIGCPKCKKKQKINRQPIQKI